MSLRNLEVSFDPSFYNPEFIKFIEDNINYFNNPKDLKEITFEPARGYQYEGDLYGLFNFLNIPPHMHYLTMRINGYDTPMDFKADRISIFVYSGRLVNNIAKALSTKNR